MRPRLIAVDDLVAEQHTDGSGLASMRPRLIAVDDMEKQEPVGVLNVGFNEATAYCRGCQPLSKSPVSAEDLALLARAVCAYVPTRSSQAE